MTADADIVRWKAMSDLTFELADTLYTLFNAITDFCKKNNIPIQEQEGLWNLTKKTKAIFSEIEQISSPCYKRPSDDWKHGNKSDGEVTEPYAYKEVAATLRGIHIVLNRLLF
jgi:hypothetical protein